MAVVLHVHYKTSLLVVCGMFLCAILRGGLHNQYVEEPLKQKDDFTHEVNLETTTSTTTHKECHVDYLNVPPPSLKNKDCEESGQCLDITCAAIFHGNVSDQTNSSIYSQITRYLKNNYVPRVSIRKYFDWTQNCKNFTEVRGYITEPLSQEEEDFPIAYSILAHRDIEQLERLLRGVYHPQNQYCIHVDAKASVHVINAARVIANCFDNVFIASKLEHVVYAGFSRLQADINCMRDHLMHSSKWKYLINTAAMAFPLKTNAELVQILKIYNGANDIEGMHKRVLRSRFRVEWIEVNKTSIMKNGMNNTTPPHDIEIVRGSAYGVFSHAFVQYMVVDQKAVDLLEWSKRTYSPDEHYWATLHHTFTNPHLRPPGGFAGDPDSKPWLAVYANWGGTKCYGVGRHSMCVFGTADLPHLTTRKEMFCNKFVLNFQPPALECLEALIRQRTLCPEPIDRTYYENLPFVIKDKNKL